MRHLRSKIFATSSALALLGAGLLVTEREARACGGCFNPPENPTVVTDHRMIFSISTAQSTLYDQIKYAGDPKNFAWVLPYKGDPNNGEIKVGVSSDIVFSALDQTTQTTIIAPQPNCPGPPSGCAVPGSSARGNGVAPEEDGVSVLKREVVGPFDTVHLKATTPDALKQWLSDNGYKLPDDVLPVVTTYQNEQFNFLAVKLTPGQGVQDMRPIRVTTKGANIALPLRMVAAGTGPTVGITLWVLGEGRYEPQNFPSFSIKETDLVWKWAEQKSNYTELRAQKTTEGGGRAWEVESSIIYYRQQLEQTIKNGSWNGSGPQPTTDAERAAIDYLPAKDDQQAIVQTPVQVRDEDIDTLFYGIGTATSRVTRLRADLAHAALDADLRLQAAGDQAVLATTRTVTKEEGQPQCPVFSGCDQTGTAPRDQAIAASSPSSASTFSCATHPSSSHTWLGIGFGFAAVAAGQALRRRRGR